MTTVLVALATPALMVALAALMIELASYPAEDAASRDAHRRRPR